MEIKIVGPGVKTFVIYENIVYRYKGCCYYFTISQVIWTPCATYYKSKLMLDVDVWYEGTICCVILVLHIGCLWWIYWRLFIKWKSYKWII